MDIFDVMFNCRAMRRLDTKPVPAELLIKLVASANQAPSGSNMQIARWIVVTDESVKKKLADLKERCAIHHQPACKGMAQVVNVKILYPCFPTSS